MKRLALAIALVLVLVGCAGGGQTTSGEDEIKVGMIQFADHVSLDAANEGFQEGLSQSGLNVTYDLQNANGDPNVISQVASKFKADGVDLVYAIATPAAQGVMAQIEDIPIVFSAVTDPLGGELVDNLESPGGNVTGVSDYIDPKSQIEKFLEIYPEAKTLGVIYNTGEQNSRVQVDELKAKAGELGIEIKEVGISQVNDIPVAITSLQDEVDGLFAITDNMVASAAEILAQNLIEHGIPSVSSEEGQVKAGLLFSEGVNYYEHGKQAGEMAAKILEGIAISDLPVEYNKNNVMLVNETTRAALGLAADLPVFQGAEKVE